MLDSDSRLRRMLQALSDSAGTPFLAGQRAYYDLPNSPDFQAPGQIFVLEDEYLPTPHDVGRTGLFAYSAAAFALDSTSNTSVQRVLDRPLGFPVPEVDSNGRALGFGRLIRDARRRLSGVRSNLFLAAANELIEDISSLNIVLVRLAPLDEACQAPVADLMLKGKVGAIVGIDSSRPDFTDDVLFRAVGKNLVGVDDEYACASDLAVTLTLNARERTGFFWRFLSMPPNDQGYTIASCYARLDDAFPPIRVDIEAPAGRLGEAAEVVLSMLSGELLFPPKSGRLLELSDILGSDDAVVPMGAQVLMDAAIALRAANPVIDFYRTRLDA